MTPTPSRRFPYVLSRIIGNELPMRDEPGGRLKAYRFILENEPDFPTVFKRWVINRVYSQEYLTQIINLLQEFDASYAINPFIGRDYRKCRTRDEKTVYAINANVGRNFILQSRNLADFNLVFDGECMLTQKAYEEIHRGIVLDQWKHKYYSVPMKRVHADHFRTTDHDALPLEEPQLIFGHDSDLTFKEAMVYPVHDKCELLWRLGHSHEHRKQYVLDRTDLCLSVGYVLHVNTGSEGVEAHLPQRDDARERGKDLLLRAMDEEFGCTS